MVTPSRGGAAGLGGSGAGRRGSPPDVSGQVSDRFRVCQLEMIKFSVIVASDVASDGCEYNLSGHCGGGTHRETATRRSQQATGRSVTEAAESSVKVDDRRGLADASACGCGCGSRLHVSLAAASPGTHRETATRRSQQGKEKGERKG